MDLKELNGMLSILSTLMKDHDDLRAMIEVLKADNKNYGKKKKTYTDFSELLKAHSSSEEKAVYAMALTVPALKMGTFEAWEEHDVAKSLMLKLTKTTDKDQWMGRVKVLAEAVEHHIIEEENVYLLKLKKKFTATEELKMIDQFMRLRERSPHVPSSRHSGVLAQVKKQGSVSHPAAH
jgi:hemerythrin-like domain-containing protein